MIPAENQQKLKVSGTLRTVLIPYPKAQLERERVVLMFMADSSFVRYCMSIRALRVQTASTHELVVRRQRAICAPRASTDTCAHECKHERKGLHLENEGERDHIHVTTPFADAASRLPIWWHLHPNPTWG